MAEVKPLRLRVEKAPKVLKSLSERPFVDVIVNLPFLAPQEVFTYRLVEGCELADVGDLVSVPYGHSLVEGVIVSRGAEPGSTTKIKSIASLISHTPVFSPTQLELATALARRYATDSWSFLRSMSPPFSIMGEKSFRNRAKTPPAAVTTDSPDVKPTVEIPRSLQKALRATSGVREVVIAAPHVEIYQEIIQIALTRSLVGKVVISLPDFKDLQAIASQLRGRDIPFVINSSNQSKSERYESYLKANFAEAGIVITLRNGCLLNLAKSDTLIVVNEVESHHYERRSPTWNSRDIALLRSPQHNVIFFSSSPSVEIVKQVESRWLSAHTYSQHKVRRMTFAPELGMESRMMGDVAKALQRGNVLISVARTGYINGFTCGQCRTKAHCSCGGRLKIPMAGANPACSVCETVIINWHCPWCNSPKMWATSRGSVRTAAEYGRSFPKVRILQSSGENQIFELPDGTSLVVATLGSEPIGRYEGIFVLDAAQAYSQVELRSQEDVREQWFKLLGQLAPNGDFMISLPQADSISQGLLRSAAYELSAREMNERYDAGLPPYFRILVCEAPYTELTAIADLLTSRNFPSIALPRSGNGKGRLFVKFEVERGEEFTEIIAGIQRLRAAQKREPLTLRFDPYSIT